MKKIIGVRITNATTTGETVMTLVFENEDGKKTKSSFFPIVTRDTFTGAITYHADTKEHDEEMCEFIKTATKTTKLEGEKFAYIYK